LKRFFIGIILGLCVMNITVTGYAASRIDINDEAYLEIGLRLQPQFYSTEKDLDGDSNFDTFDDFKLRRGRIRAKGVMNDWLDVFMQTDISEDSSGSMDMRVIDAFVHMTACSWFQVYAGENMVPVMRQHVTSSAALMTIDRPGLVYKNLSWGLKSKYAFTNETYSDSDGGIKTVNSVRDMGVTFFGSDGLNDEISLKYYLGAYDGVQMSGKSSNRYAGRLQVNFFEPEKGYFNKSTYLGKKKTVGIGAAFDMQPNVAIDKTTGTIVDYCMYTADFFTEISTADEQAITFETGFVSLDLDNANILQSKSAADGTLSDIGTVDRMQVQGDGYYAQAGYLIGNWQPWIGCEAWDADAQSSKGDYSLYRIGVTYFIEGQSANVKAGYEVFEADAKIGTSNDDSASTFLLGFYYNF